MVALGCSGWRSQAGGWEGSGIRLIGCRGLDCRGAGEGLLVAAFFFFWWVGFAGRARSYRRCRISR